MGGILPHQEVPAGLPPLGTMSKGPSSGLHAAGDYGSPGSVGLVLDVLHLDLDLGKRGYHRCGLSCLHPCSNGGSALKSHLFALWPLSCPISAEGLVTREGPALLPCGSCRASSWPQCWVSALSSCPQHLSSRVTGQVHRFSSAAQSSATPTYPSFGREAEAASSELVSSG